MSPAQLGILGVTVDVSQLREAEPAPEAERPHFATMLRTLAYGLCEVDGAGRVDYLNPAGEQLLRRSASEVAGRSLHDVVHVAPFEGTPIHPDGDCAIAEVLRGGGVVEVRDTFVRRDGNTFVADLVAMPLKRGLALTGAVLTFQDVTERMRQEQLKEDYLAFASHELRSPLTVVSAMAQFLQHSLTADPAAFDDGTREAIETLAGEADRMLRLVDVVLDLARIESGQFTLELDRVDLAEIVRDEAHSVGQALPHMRLEVTGEDSFLAWSDETRIRQVLRNLLDNAGKYAGPEPRVEVRLIAEDNRARIEVSDDGPGIAAEDQPQIFERLYRGRAEGRRNSLGAGLFITREIVERLGGTLSVKSAPGQGATFTVRLPLDGVSE